MQKQIAAWEIPPGAVGGFQDYIPEEQEHLFPGHGDPKGIHDYIPAGMDAATFGVRMAEERELADARRLAQLEEAAARPVSEAQERAVAPREARKKRGPNKKKPGVKRAVAPSAEARLGEAPAASAE